MPYKSGQSGNPKGRKRGALNKKTSESISRAKKLLEAIEASPQWSEMIISLTPKELKDWHSELMEYVESKRARVDERGETSNTRTIRVIHSIQTKELNNTIDIDYEH
jgi:hypothetical protein